MSDMPSDSNGENDQTAILQQRADRLEREVAELRQESQSKLIHAELKAEAVRAGMIDLDGLKLLDASELNLDKDGNVVGGSAVMDRFKRIKPWLFGGGSSSMPVAPPPAQPARSKLATEMTEAEYKAARATIIKQKN
jgi:hypothetical protein